MPHPTAAAEEFTEEFYSETLERSVLICAAPFLSSRQELNLLLEKFRESGGSDGDAGRGSALRCKLRDGRSVVIRGFRRGGLVARIGVSNFFLRPFRASRLRPLAELRLLVRLREIGTKVPEPACAEVRWRWGGLVYTGTIVTEEIPNSLNLLAEAKRGGTAEQELALIAEQAGRETARLTEEGVFHPDLHPGNVLFQPGSRSVFLIDFDRARYFPLRQKYHYQNRLLARWERSTRKHGLGHLLDEPFRRGLCL